MAPGILKGAVFSALLRLSKALGLRVGPYLIYRLPFGLAVKICAHSNEADALQFVSTVQGINVPMLIGRFTTPQYTYMLYSWVDGDCAALVWEELSEEDKERLIEDLRLQFGAIRQQTESDVHAICTVSGGDILDPRMPWLVDEPRPILSAPDFFQEVWRGIDFPRNRDLLYPMIRPLIERETVPVVFCHGDTATRNIIFPGGLRQWRLGKSRVSLIDWQYAGWMPYPWEILKATFLCVYEEDEWLELMRRVFPDSSEYLDADWQYRTHSNVTLV